MFAKHLPVQEKTQKEKVRLPGMEPEPGGYRDQHNIPFMSDKEILSNYMPENAVNQVYDWIIENKIHFKITKSRRTKLGDYRPPIRHANHRITVNHDLNQYSFLITFVHELAHMKVFEKYNRDVLPHGTEWKQEYRDLMKGFLEGGIFPNDLKEVLSSSIQNSKASSTSDIRLSRALKKYDHKSPEVHVEDLEHGTVFMAQNGRQFVKGDKVRTRFKCQNLQNRRIYLFHPLTPVEAVS